MSVETASAPPPWRTPEAKALRRERREQRRNYFAQTRRPAGIGERPLVKAAASWLLPWPSNRYPGQQRGIRQALGIGQDSAEQIRIGHASARQMLRMAELIEERCRVGAALAHELREAVAARRRKPAGLQIVGEDGARAYVRRGRPPAVSSDARGVPQVLSVPQALSAIENLDASLRELDGERSGDTPL